MSPTPLRFMPSSSTEPIPFLPNGFGWQGADLNKVCDAMCAIKQYDNVIHMLPANFPQSLCIAGLVIFHIIWMNSWNSDSICIAGFSISVIKAALRATLKLQRKIFPHRKSLQYLVCTISIKRLTYLQEKDDKIHNCPSHEKNKVSAKLVVTMSLFNPQLFRYKAKLTSGYSYVRY